MENLVDFIINHPFLWAAFFVLSFLIIQHEIKQRRYGVRQAGPQMATQLMNHEDAVFVDVREDKELGDGIIANAVHIPLSQLQNRIAELDKYKGRPVVAYCRSGNRSFSAGSKLRKAGFESVYNLTGGILAWQNANLPTTRK
jgi:rhodanese-related sulfurtransferase